MGSFFGLTHPLSMKNLERFLARALFALNKIPTFAFQKKYNNSSNPKPIQHDQKFHPHRSRSPNTGS